MKGDSREAVPLQGLGQGLLQVGGGSWEGELDGDAAAVVEDGGEVVSFRRGQDGQLVVGLTCRGDTGSSGHVYRNMADLKCLMDLRGPDVCSLTAKLLN